jgi:hypothetical protein
VAEIEAADGVNHYGVMLLGAASELLAYRVTPSRAGSHHRVYVRPLTEGRASPLWSIESGSNGLPFAGAALSESVLWTLVPDTGFVLELQGTQVGGPLDGQSMGDPVPFVARTGTPKLMGAREGLLWIRDGEALVLIDVSDPRRPREAATLDFAGIVTAAELHGDRLWIGHPRVSSPGTSQRSGGGLEVFDVGDARSPRLLASVELGEPPSDLVVDEDGAWVSASAVQRFVYAPAPTPTNTLVAPTASASPVPSATATPAAAVATASPRPLRYGVALPWLAAGAAP